MKKRWVLTILPLIIICNLAFGACSLRCLYAAQDISKEDESLFIAKKAFEDRFYEVSLGLLERFLKNYPNSSKAQEAMLYIGRCYFNLNRYLDALSKFEGLLNQSAAKNMKDALYFWIAEVHFKGNNFSLAAAYYKKIIDEFPKSGYISSAYYSLGWCLFQGRDFKQAIELFEIVEDRYPKDPPAKDVAIKIIECLYNLKDYSALKDKAKSYLKAYSKDAVNLSILHFYAAEADYYLNNFTDAIESYQMVLKNNTDDKMQSLSKLGIGWSYLKIKRHKEAENAFFEIKAQGLEKPGRDILLLGKAVLMAQTARLSEAGRLYDELLKAAETPFIAAQAYLGKADALYDAMEYREAIATYTEALRKIDEGLNTVALPPQAQAEKEPYVPQDIIDKLHYGLAWSFLKQAEFKEAIKEFQKIVRTSEDKTVKVSALCQIGDAYQDSGDYNKAQEAYDAILKDYPDSFYSDYVQYQSGLTLLKNSNYNGAILSLLALKRNFPDSKLLDEASYALGLAYFQKQDYRLSREIFEKFNEEFKDSSLKPQALYLLGASLYNLGSFSEAVEVFKNIIRFYPQDAETVQKAEYEIADCFYRMGNEREAMARFKNLRSRYPNSSLTPEIMWWLSGYYYRHNELDLSRRYLIALIQDFPKSNLVADAYYVLGSSYEDESRHEEAIDNFKKVIETGKTDLSGQAAIAIADICVRQDKLDLAISSYKEIIKTYPNLSMAIYPKLADLFLKTNNYNDSIDFYRKTLDGVSVKDMAGIQLKIAEAYQGQGQLPEAIEEYLKVSYLYPENNETAVKALLRVAQIYEDKENFKEASNVYRRIIAMNTEEAKYARERIDAITGQVKQ